MIHICFYDYLTVTMMIVILLIINLGGKAKVGWQKERGERWYEELFKTGTKMI